MGGTGSVAGRLSFSSIELIAIVLLTQTIITFCSINLGPKKEPKPSQSLPRERLQRFKVKNGKKCTAPTREHHFQDPKNTPNQLKPSKNHAGRTLQGESQPKMRATSPKSFASRENAMMQGEFCAFFPRGRF